MATYIALVNFTDQGVRQIRHTTERAKALINAASNLGVKIKDIYWTMGALDAVLIAEAAGRRKRDGLCHEHRILGQHSHPNPTGVFGGGDESNFGKNARG